MGIRKSQTDVDFYVDLLGNVLADAYACFPSISPRELERDLLRVRTRAGNEGFAFLSKTLPKLGKALDKGLEAGHLTVPSEFARKRKAGETWNIPSLFSALFMTIFDTTGTLVQVEDTAVGMIRQLCFLCYKVETPIDPELVKARLDRFVETDRSLPGTMPGDVVSKGILRNARLLLRRLFRDFDPGEIAPRHGPGAVAERVFGREKYNETYYDRGIDSLYPYVRFCTFAVHTQNLDDLVAHTKLARDVSPARVVCVPKDSRGPRIISCEPALLQYLQQGLARKIYRLVERSNLTRGHVLFTDQSTHRGLALRSSRDGQMATLDLSDASDRVSLELVRALFPESLTPYLLATRSKITVLPDGRSVELRKFAPMGSALCFPIEALCFWALASSVIGLVSRTRDLRRKRVFVYGDDIIVEARHARSVVALLEPFGLKFNADKCFIGGRFRESCGCDAFNGEDVTPVRIRVHRTQAPGTVKTDCLSLSQNATAFFDKGYWRTAEFLWTYCEKYIGRLPVTSPEFQGPCRTSRLLPSRWLHPNGNAIRWNRDFQRIEVKTYYLRSRQRVSPFPRNVMRLGHNLLQGCPRPYSDQVAVPHSALTKAGWAPLL